MPAIKIIGRDEGRHIVLVDGCRQTVTDAELVALGAELPDAGPEWKAPAATSVDMAAAAQIADANGFVVVRKEEHDALLRTQVTESDVKEFAQKNALLILPKDQYDQFVEDAKAELEAAKTETIEAKLGLSVSDAKLKAAQDDLKELNELVEHKNDELKSANERIEGLETELASQPAPMVGVSTDPVLIAALDAVIANSAGNIERLSEETLTKLLLARGVSDIPDTKAAKIALLKPAA